ncbi:hypothetical protein DSOL_2821 [Desulfosporosinus metallidurans]|uniref:YtkA-like domain-containing protein n=2 Tax=Desulfosporosinus metallidurans TaxID=1888891 RepID=A0A1Q8QV32_9FIRM|nr:hypothetical protein DSOL_2821 [Desulfosporosinus metallidurans]
MQTNPENFMANQAGTMTMIITNKATGQPVTGAKVMMSKSTMMSSNAGSNSGNMAGMTMNSGSYMMEGMTFNQPGQWNQAITISSPLD